MKQLNGCETFLSGLCRIRKKFLFPTCTFPSTCSEKQILQYQLKRLCDLEFYSTALCCSIYCKENSKRELLIGSLYELIKKKKYSLTIT